MTDQQPSSEIKKGEMPTPRYFQVEQQIDKSLTKMIGVEGYTLDGDIKTFIFWRNLQLDNSLNSNIGREKAARNIAQMKFEYETDVAIGPGIELSECDATIGKIATLSDSDIVGIYIEKDQQIMRRRNESNPGSPEYLNYLRKARESLPRPPQQKQQEK